MFRKAPSLTQATLSQRLEEVIRAHADKAWRVAFTYLYHAEDAADAVQQAAMVLARKVHQLPESNTWPWFRAIVIGEARNLRRKRAHRPLPMADCSAGGAVEPEEPGHDPALAATLRESRAALWQALGQLSEAQRDAIVLTHVNGMTQREAANLLGIPHQTLASNVQRGLAALREKSLLRESTIVQCLPILPILEPPGGMASALAGWLGASQTALATTALGGGATGLTTGVTLMANKLALAVTAATALLIGGGTTLLLYDTKEPSIPLVQEPAPDDGRIKQLEADLLERDTTIQRQSSQLKELQNRPDNTKEIAASAQRIAELEAALVEAQAERDAALEQLKPTEAVDSFKSVFGFGAVEGIKEMRDADWPKLAATMAEMQRLVDEAIAKDLAGEAPNQNLMNEIERLNKELVRFAVGVMGKVDTHAPMSNGEFTHPFATFMLMKERLEVAGFPLDARQLAEITRMGERYTSEWKAKERGYNADTLNLRKIVDEFLLKLDHSNNMHALLNTDQLKALYFNGHSRGINQVDMYSPLIMTITMASPFGQTDREKLRQAFSTQLGQSLKLTPDDLARLTNVINDYWQEVEPVLHQAVDTNDLYHFNEADARVAYSAFVKLLESVPEILRWKDSADPRLENVKGLGLLVLPRLLKTQ